MRNIIVYKFMSSKEVSGLFLKSWNFQNKENCLKRLKNTNNFKVLSGVKIGAEKTKWVDDIQFDLRVTGIKACKTKARDRVNKGDRGETPRTVAP